MWSLFNNKILLIPNRIAGADSIESRGTSYSTQMRTFPGTKLVLDDLIDKNRRCMLYYVIVVILNGLLSSRCMVILHYCNELTDAYRGFLLYAY